MFAVNKGHRSPALFASMDMGPPRLSAPFFVSSLRATGSRECAPDDRLREAIHPPRKERKDCFRAKAPRLSQAMTEAALRRRLLLRREAAVEGFALRRHLLQQLRRGEARAVFGFELVA